MEEHALPVVDEDEQVRVVVVSEPPPDQPTDVRYEDLPKGKG